MPQTTTVTTYTIFVGSPDDVRAEREQVPKIIEDLNQMFHDRNIRLRSIQWEKDVRPGVANNPQDVIDRQVTTDYDIFVGIMWLTTGGTSKRTSGTIREYEAARKKVEQGKQTEIFFYFKTLPPDNLDVLDPSKFAEVKSFKSSFGESGLYFEFEQTSDFEKLLRRHLVQFINGIDANETVETEATTITVVSKDSENSSQDLSELGLFDLNESITENSERLIEIVNGIGNATEEIGDRIRSHANDLQKLTSTNGNVSPALAKRIINSSAADLNRYCDRLDTQLSQYKRNLDSMMNIGLEIIEIIASFSSTDGNTDRLREQKEILMNLKRTMIDSEESFQGFRDSVATLPKLTTELNRAKRRTVRNIAQFIDYTQDGRVKLEEIVQVLDDHLDTNDDEN